ncbi:hypothetical protein Scep_007570 [Stephania cephalantha]|uniref:Uncharacterized protein n=1 Tax=Stephania cephalantha TaxID=152367 RepID=A0AAP0KA38_9MAGN
MEGEEEKDLLTAIKPPRVEDAGLEDCALSPESIKEAFFKAANSIRSSWPSPNQDKDAKLSDTLIGIAPTSDPGGPCGNEIGGGIPEVLGDEVAVGISGAQNEEDAGGGGGFEVPSQEGDGDGDEEYVPHVKIVVQYGGEWVATDGGNKIYNANTNAEMISIPRNCSFQQLVKVLVTHFKINTTSHSITLSYGCKTVIGIVVVKVNNDADVHHFVHDFNMSTNNITQLCLSPE